MNRHAILTAVLLVGCSGQPCPPVDAASAPRLPGNVAGENTGQQHGDDGKTGGSSELSPTPAELPDGMVRVPAGEFLRGSVDSIGLEDEHPQRKIFLDAFDIDRTEVSVGAFGKCVAAGACSAPACTEDGDEPETHTDFPVVCVTWAQASAFCGWAKKSLPTEAQWEKAARGTEGAKYPWGEGEPSCTRANHHACGNARMAVDSLPAGKSPFGALNMAGNVYEWVGDWHHAAYYALSPTKNPVGPWSGEKKVVRGGAFSYGADSLEAHARTYDRPVKAYDQVGFRCASLSHPGLP